MVHTGKFQGRHQTSMIPMKGRAWFHTDAQQIHGPVELQDLSHKLPSAPFHIARSLGPVDGGWEHRSAPSPQYGGCVRGLGQSWGFTGDREEKEVARILADPG